MIQFIELLWIVIDKIENNKMQTKLDHKRIIRMENKIQIKQPTESELDLHKLGTRTEVSVKSLILVFPQIIHLPIEKDSQAQQVCIILTWVECDLQPQSL